MKRILSLLLFFLFTLLAANVTVAQQEQDTESSMLPEIDPQDIEIRSQFQARFPGLRRQPILGFDPNPRVYQIDPDRTPFMETQRQVVANVPISQLSGLRPPEYLPFQYAEPKNVFARLGFGSYMSPEAQLWGVSRLSEKSYVGGDLDFSSSDGHLDTQNTSFRFFDANAEYATKLNDKSRLDITGGAESSFNNMFDLPSTAIASTARKNYDGIRLGAGFQHFKNTVTGWKADANIRYYNTELANSGPQDGLVEERAYNLSVTKRWAGNKPHKTFSLKAGAKGGNYEHSTTNTSWVTAQVAGGYEQLFNYTTKLAVDISGYYTESLYDDSFYLGPQVSVEHPVMDILTVKVEAGAEPYLKTQEQLHTNNRFLTVENNLRHSYRMYGKAEAKVDYVDNGKFNFGFQYEDISENPIYQRQNNGVVDNSGERVYEFYEIRYFNVYKVSAYAGVVQAIIPEKLSVNAKIYLRSPKIKDGNRIPFEEKIGINSGLAIHPVDGVTFEAWADYVGPRQTMQTGEKLDGFILLGGQADIQITKRFGAYIKLVNLLNQDYEVWQGYTEQPFQAYGGLTVKL